MSSAARAHYSPDLEVQRSILLATLHDLSVHHLADAISSAAQWTHKRLIILLVSRLFNKPSSNSASECQEAPISHTQKWNEVQSLLTCAYVQATKVAQQLNRVLMEVDVLLKGIDETLPDDLANDVDILYRVHHG
jgi:pantetheine-phosphate adenylyltransferase